MFRKGDEPIPGYRLEEFLGRGQFGEVWRTTAPGGTSAALKFINLRGVYGVKEFRGIQRVKEIRHAHLMPITALWMLDRTGRILGDAAIESYKPEAYGARETLEPGEPEDEKKPEWLVVAMLLGKENLQDRLEHWKSQGREGIPGAELLGYMEEAAKGIDFLNSPQHDLGKGPVSIQHGDIKPANIMLVGDSVVICDFGLARLLTEKATTATAMVGSPAYMAPECINRRPSHASDQYSLAITYVELRTGRLPFYEESLHAILDSHRKGRLDLSRLARAERDAVRKATAVNPADRFPSAVAMVQTLKRTFDGKAGRFAVRHRLWAVGLFTLLVVSATLLVVWRWAPLWNGRPWGTAGSGASTGGNVRAQTVTIEPAAAQVTINGVPLRLNAAGEGTVEFADGRDIKLRVWHTEDFERLERSFSWKQLQQMGFRVRLEHSAKYYASRAFESLTANDWPAAVKSYQQAIRLDTSYAAPTPIELRQHTAAVRNLRFASSERWLVSAGDDGLACAWDLKRPEGPTQPRLLRGHAQSQPVDCAAISNDGRWVATGSWDNTARVWDLEAENPAARPSVLIGHSEDVVAVEFSPDGRRVITASFDRTLRLWNLPLSEAPADAVVLRGHASEIEHMAVTADGHWLISIDSAGETRRWDLTASDPSAAPEILTKRSHRVKCCLVSSDGRWLVTGGDDGKVVSSDLAPPSEPRSLAASNDEIEAIVMDRGQRRMAASNSSGRIHIWDVSDAGAIARTRVGDGHVGPVVAMAISPDGRWLISGGWDKAVFLWDLDAPDPSAAPLRLPGHKAPVHAVAVGNNGTWCASGDEKGTVLLWRLPQCELIQRSNAELGSLRKERVET